MTMFDFSEFDKVALDRVRQSYAGRPYHNFHHIEKMLADLDSRPGLRLDPLSKKHLQIAIIFHDVIYDPRATDNEEKSVEFMRNAALIHPAQNDTKKISELIMATKHHRYGEDALCDTIIDLDLAVLRQNFMGLVEYEHAIFKEYQFTNVANYTAKRVQFLRQLIENLSNQWRNDFSFDHLKMLVEYVENRQYRIGIFAGSFSPFHIGHLSCVRKAESVFDKVVIARGVNPQKSKINLAPMPKSLPNEMIEYHGMVTELFKSPPKNVKYFLIRGLRNEYDLQLEENMRRWIKELDASVEIVYFFCDSQYEHISSTMLKDLAKIDSDFVDKYIVK